MRNLINVYNFLKGGCKDNGAMLSLVPCDRTRHIGHKQKYRRFLLNIRKHFLYCE